MRPVRFGSVRLRGVSVRFGRFGSHHPVRFLRFGSIAPSWAPWAPRGPPKVGPLGTPWAPRFPNGARISWGAAAPQTPRNAGGAKAPPPPFKSAFGLRSSLAIASSLARYRELEKAGRAAATPAPPPQIMRGLRPLKLPQGLPGRLGLPGPR